MSETEPAYQDLSGYWTGVYDYPHGLSEPVPFNVSLTEADGALTGEMIEPNTFCHDGLGDVFASVMGARDGQTVRFAKRYEQREGAGHRVDYVGEANAALTEIRGRWTIDGFSGPFVMNRTAQGVAAAIEQREEIDL